METVAADEEMRGCGTPDCIPFHLPYRLDTYGARWGHEWAAVAWMALSIEARANRMSEEHMIPLDALKRMAADEYRAHLGATL